MIFKGAVEEGPSWTRVWKESMVDPQAAVGVIRRAWCAFRLKERIALRVMARRIERLRTAVRQSVGGVVAAPPQESATKQAGSLL